MDWRSGQTYPEDLRARVLVAMDGSGLAFERSVFRHGALARHGLTGSATTFPKSGHPGAKPDDHLDVLIAQDALSAQAAELPIFSSSGRRPSVA